MQSAAVAYCLSETAGPRILLITSKRTRRWVLPKGWPKAGETLVAAAKREAFEEAGVIGDASGEHQLGEYAYEKQLGRGLVECRVVVFALCVRAIAANWPERGQRGLRWCSPEQAARLVHEPALAAILAEFAPPARPASLEQLRSELHQAETLETKMTNLSDTRFARPAVYASEADALELQALAGHVSQASPAGALLRQEVARLSVDAPAGVTFVKLGSWAAYRDLRSKRERHVRIVRPEQANPEENYISVLSPLGAALIGLAQGAIFRWSAPDGQLRAVKVLEVFGEDPARSDL